MSVWLSMDMSYVGAGDQTNTSKVAVNVYVHWDSVSYNGLAPALNVTVDGVNDIVNVSFNTGQISSGSQNIYSKYWNIGHDSNGSARTVYGSASYATGTASGTVGASASLALDAIDSGGGSEGGDSGGGDSGEGSEDDGGSGGNTGSGDIITDPLTNCIFLGSSNGGGSYGNNHITIQADTISGFYKFKTYSSSELTGKVTIHFDCSVDLNGDDDYAVRVSLRETESGSNIATTTTCTTTEFDSGYKSTYVLTASSLMPDTEYYICISCYSEPSSQAILYADATPIIIVDYVKKNPGIYIDCDSKFDIYQCYIDTEYVEYPTNDIACEISGQTYARSNIDSESWNVGSYNTTYEAYWGAVPSGYGYTNYDTYYLKFSTPSFVGTSKSIKFNIKMKSFTPMDVDSVKTVRYALCTSDENKNSYLRTVSAVNDPYQIITGTFSESSGDGATSVIVINTDKLQSNTTYYLIIWDSHVASNTSAYVKTMTSGNHSIVLTCEDKDNPIYGTKFMKYIPYIDNGTSWEIIS